MSHSVTITRTTTTNSTSALILNTGYLKTLPGLLKLAQLVTINWQNFPKLHRILISKWFSQTIQIIGAVCVGLVAHYYTNYSNYRGYYGYTAELFFLLMATSFLIGTFCLLVSCLFSLSTGGIISKTIYVSETLSFPISLNNEFNWIISYLLSGTHLSFDCLRFALMCISLFACENWRL